MAEQEWVQHPDNLQAEINEEWFWINWEEITNL